MTARLVATRVPRTPRGVVLVLHGGASREQGVQVSPTQLSVVRMIPIARKIARAGHRQLAVFRLLNSARGWDTSHTPVDDVRWALDELRARFDPLPPVALVGHSLGGRAAILSAVEPEVRSVAALAPFVYPGDGRIDASGTRMLIVHGSADRIADPGRSRTVAEELRRTTTVGYVRVEGGKHAMLRRHAAFSAPAAQFTVSTLLDEHPRTGSPAARALAGESDFGV